MFLTILECYFNINLPLCVLSILKSQSNSKHLFNCNEILVFSQRLFIYFYQKGYKTKGINRQIEEIGINN